MTLAQVDGALKAVEQEDRRRLRDALTVVRGGQAPAKDFKALVRRLESETG